MNYMSHSQLFDLSGKSAIVSGGAMGIGKAIAERLSEAGAAVVIADIDPTQGRETAEELSGKKRKAIFQKTDVSSLADIEATIELAEERFGGIDILVNNAGIFPLMPALDLGEELWERVLDINLKGAFFFARQAARKMIIRGHGGRIINIASIDAFKPLGNLAHYDASKGGVVMMTRSLALEWGKHNILVNAIAPGFIKTPGAAKASAVMTEGAEASPAQSGQMNQAFTARIPLGRQGEADEIAAAVLFLASPAASYITGETLVVDGGYLIS